MKYRTLLALVTLTLSLGGCGKKEAPPPQPGAAADAATTAEGAQTDEQQRPRRELEPVSPGPTGPTGGTPGQAPALPGPFATTALFAVPKSAPFVVVGTPKKILDALGYAQLAQKHSALLAGASREMAEVAGKDLLQLSAWAEIGIDLEGTMGIFMPELESEALVTFVRLSDPAKFQTFVTDTAKKVEAPLETEKVGDATLITVGGGDRNAWLVRGDTLFAVAVLGGNGAAALAKEIHARPAADSIAALPELNATLEGLALDEVGAFVQLRAILDKTLVAELDSPLKLATGQLDAELEAAKKAGVEAEIARLEAAVAEEKAFFERVTKRREAERELVKGIVGELSTLAIGLDLSPDAAEASVRLPLAADGKLRGLLRNASDLQPILRAGKEQPLLLLSGQIDPQAYLSLMEKMMAAEGDDLSEARAALKETFGIDLDADIVGALSGEIGFALTGDVSKLLTAADPRKELGGALVLGLKSAAGLKGLAARLASQEGIRELATWDEATTSLTLDLPEGPKVQLVFEGNRLVASTDLETAKRLAGGEGFVSSLANTKLKALLERKDLAALFAMPQSFIGAWMFAMRGGSWTPELPADASAEAKAKLAELHELDAEIAPLRASVEAARMKPVIDAFDKLGTMAEAVTMDARGAAAVFGLYPKGATLPEVIDALIDAAMSQERQQAEPSPDEVKLRELEDRRWKLESEIFSFNRPKVDELPPEEPEAPKQP